MDHLKSALLSKLKHVKSHKDAGVMESDHGHGESASEDKQEMDMAPDLADRKDEIHGNEEIDNPGLSYDSKDAIVGAIAEHNDSRNPGSMHSRAALHAKNHLHEMKNKKPY